MTISLHNLRPAPGSRKRVKRLGRGTGSGRGTTAGKGTKGQRARQGGRKNLRQMGMKWMTQSTPKLGGFSSIFSKDVALPVSVLNRFKSDATVTLGTLVRSELVAASVASVKFVDGGSLKVKIHLKGLKATAGARKKIESAGGSIIE